MEEEKASCKPVFLFCFWCAEGRESGCLGDSRDVLVMMLGGGGSEGGVL